VPERKPPFSDSHLEESGSYKRFRSDLVLFADRISAKRFVEK